MSLTGASLGIAGQPAKNADNGNNGAQANAAPTNTNNSSPTSNPGHSKMGCHQTPYGATGPGANHSGPYDDTCTGAPSGNGNGQATGKPCAGCVGKADEKNPKGSTRTG